VQSLDRARHPLSRGLLVAAQRLANGTKVTLLEKPQQDGGPILRPQLLDRIV
jgi:hypothetical protein